MAHIYEDTPILKFKKANCKNCYKCVRNCPVKAIRVISHQAQIIESQCILCEKCTLVCPQNAKEEWNFVPYIQLSIQKGKKLLASLHPAYLAEFGLGSLRPLADALKQIGFLDVFDASEGAFLMKTRYEELLKERNQQMPTISSNCPVIVQLIEKQYPDLIPNMAPILSMMQAHAKYLKLKYPEAEIVSISPCISGLSEMKEKENYVDYVITFNELQCWMQAEGVTVSVPEPNTPDDIRLSRIAAVSGGISCAMRPLDGQRYIPSYGLDSCQKLLSELRSGTYKDCFLELSACPDGCIGGPSFQRSHRGLLHALTSIQNASLYKCIPDYEKDFFFSDRTELHRPFSSFIFHPEKSVSEEEIKQILAQMGKTSPAEELNCGACGYNTCREKAIAVSQGKAEISMCVPFMRERQESYSNKIINAMPGLLVTVDYQLNVIHINRAAKNLFDPLRRKKIIGEPVSQLMDDYTLINMISFDKNMSHDQIMLEKDERYLDRVMTNDRKNQLILCVMKDVTREMQEKKRIRKAQCDAAAMADKLVAEQLKIVQQIAGLLGETAADTKVAVEELKRTILQENEKTHG